jgi:hypothetical protein
MSSSSFSIQLSLLSLFQTVTTGCHCPVSAHKLPSFHHFPPGIQHLTSSPPPVTAVAPPIAAAAAAAVVPPAVVTWDSHGSLYLITIDTLW